jgi:hypothetical protein
MINNEIINIMQDKNFWVMKRNYTLEYIAREVVFEKSTQDIAKKSLLMLLIIKRLPIPQISFFQEEKMSEETRIVKKHFIQGCETLQIIKEFIEGDFALDFGSNENEYQGKTIEDLYWLKEHEIQVHCIDFDLDSWCRPFTLTEVLQAFSKIYQGIND